MTRILLVRHAEPAAPWHVADDPGLSEQGVTQAEATAEALVHVQPARVLTSPMRRCQETAAPLAQRLSLTPDLEPRVTEVPSPATADRQAWLRATFPGAIEGGEARGWGACGGEVLRWRADVIAALCALQDDAVVFTHYVAINAAVSAALDVDLAMVCRPAHASVTELSSEQGVLRLVAHGAQVDGRRIA